MEMPQTACPSDDLNKEPNTLASLKALVGNELCEVNTLILKSVQSSISLIPLMTQNLMTAGGKRLRPMLTLASAKLCEARQVERAIPLAASIEFIHAATLLHDDVIDGSSLRRGKPTAKATWGNQASILVGDFLFVKAFQLMLQDGSPRILDLLSKASARIVEGEMLQLTTQGDLETNQEQHLDVVLHKTAPLFEAAMGVGALVAESSENTVKNLMSFGRYLGACFQLVDDVLDYNFSSQTTGKARGDDFRDTKVTLPIILAYSDGTAQEKAFWTRTFVEKDQKESDLQQAFAYLNKHKALERTLDVAKEYADQAQQCLTSFPASQPRIAFEEAIAFCLNRSC